MLFISVLFPCSSQQYGSWPQETCSWFSKLLVGKPVDMVVVGSSPGSPNEVTVDILLPSELLFSPESLANFPIPFQSMESLSQYQLSTVPLSLTSFLLSVSLARPSAPSPCCCSPVLHVVPSTLSPVAPCSLPCSPSLQPLLASTPCPPQPATFPPCGGTLRATTGPLPIQPAGSLTLVASTAQLPLLTPQYYASALTNDGNSVESRGPVTSTVSEAKDCPSEGTNCPPVGTDCQSGGTSCPSEGADCPPGHSGCVSTAGCRGSAAENLESMAREEKTVVQDGEMRTDEGGSATTVNTEASQEPTDSPSGGREEEEGSTAMKADPATRQEQPSPTKTTPPSFVLDSRDLKPLSIQLGSSGDFRLLVAHVISPSLFFVYPIQSQTTSDMSALPYLLHQHYSDASKCNRLSREQAKVGATCCVFSPEDDVWCRGVIVSVTEEKCEKDRTKRKAKSSRKKGTRAEGVLTKKRYKVLAVDYGNTCVVDADGLWLLNEEHCKFPVLCVACSLAGISPALPSVEKRGEDGTRSQHKSDEGRGRSLNDSGIESPPLQAGAPQPGPPGGETQLSNSLAAVAPNATSGNGAPPSEDGWSAEAIELLKQLTEDNRLVGLVSPASSSSTTEIALPSWDAVLRVQLFDTNGDNDVCIVDSLIGAGLAIEQGTLQ